MSDNLKDILSNLNKDIEQEKLLEYLNKKLSAAEAHEVEKQMADDEFINDAVEGLEHFKNKKDLSLLIEQLNNELKKQTAKKKKKKEKRKLRDQPWFYVTLVILLLLVIIGFILIKKYLGE
jgi:Rps23 Pro-64 3,4-dihydroxylase Tpa1-like proline 4-hydroxylase